MSKKIESYNFDWDDNILFLDSKIRIYHKKTLKFKDLSTNKFAIHRKCIGKKGIYKDYFILEDNDVMMKDGKALKSSFWEFRDTYEPVFKNNFTAQVIKALDDKKYGPSFKHFCNCLNSKKKSEWVTIITARGHEPSSILEALVYLKDKGYIKYLPKVSNIYPVSNPKIKGNAKKPCGKKLEIIKNILNNIKSVASNVEHFFHFSDDDVHTIKKVHRSLRHYLNRPKWKNINIKLYNTSNPAEIKEIEV